MNFITDYQLDIDKGFMCKVNGVAYQFDFKYSTRKYLYYVSNILKLADFLEIDRSELKGIFNNETAYDVIYCDSKQQCYDLCQHIVKTYFKPIESSSSTFVCWRYNEKTFKFKLTRLAGKFIWKNEDNPNEHIIKKTQIDIQKVKKELGINIYTISGVDYLGFDTKEDALKFANYIKVQLYDKQELIQSSRKHLNPYYSGTAQVKFPKGTFILRLFKSGEYFWIGSDPNLWSRDLYAQFELSTDQVLEICNNLKLQAYFASNTLVFGNKEDAIKFTDYLIETYIIKKEKTYDTNQLRKERTAISRGAKPAGSIIHGRRSKASVRCGCIEHKACLGN